MSLSGTINAVYVRSQDLRRVCEYYGEKCSPASLSCWFKRYVGAQFMVVGLGSTWEESSFDLAKDSREFGEAIGLRLRTRGDDALVYEHWKDGQRVRRLSFSPGEGWSSVEGLPEAWESRAFAEPVSPGQAEPALEGASLFCALLAHFRLPGVWPD